jgi:hypothetical protein
MNKAGPDARGAIFGRENLRLLRAERVTKYLPPTAINLDVIPAFRVKTNRFRHSRVSSHFGREASLAEARWKVAHTRSLSRQSENAAAPFNPKWRD